MTKTEVMLLATHKMAAIPLADICERYFGLGLDEARRKAALNLLPVPTFKTRDSREAPLLVALSDLAEFIDNQAAQAKTSWETSQL